jgi:hypothetical protein
MDVKPAWGFEHRSNAGLGTANEGANRIKKSIENTYERQWKQCFFFGHIEVVCQDMPSIPNQ